jgi:hypothetical protein
MKIRNGFVSNSSSSSFVVYGYLLKEKYVKDQLSKNEELKKQIKEDELSQTLYEIKEKLNNDIEILYDEDDGLKNNEVLFGINISKFDIDCGDIKERRISIIKLDKELENCMNELFEKYKELDVVEFCKEGPIIVCGTKLC